MLLKSNISPFRKLLVLGGAEDCLQLLLGTVRADEAGPTLLMAQEWVVPGRAMGFLAPALEAAFRQLGLAVTDLSGIACVRGPGSFTSLRLVLATAMGLAWGAELPVAGLDYLPLLAAEVGILMAGELWVLTHSRRGQVYGQNFRCMGDQAIPEPLGPAVVLSLKAAATCLNTATPPSMVCGSGWRRNALALEAIGLPSTLRQLPSLFDRPRPEILLAAAAVANYSHTPIEPCYLRSSDAEEKLDIVARGRGLDPADARATPRLAGLDGSLKNGVSTLSNDIKIIVI
ncbi:tRNA threonylcarbamoyladenosine biosynthesis protein TsaB [Desulfovibrionales bacterium]